MDIVKYLLPGLIISLKLIAFLFPFVLPIVIIRRDQLRRIARGERIGSESNVLVLSGALLGFIVGGASQLYRFGTPAGAILSALVGNRLAEARAIVNSAHPVYAVGWSEVEASKAFYPLAMDFWDHTYYAFWTEAINPLKQSLGAAIMELLMAPRGNGAILVGIILLPAAITVCWLLYKRKSVQRFLVFMLLAAFAGYYAGVAIFWGGVAVCLPLVIFVTLWAIYMIAKARSTIYVRTV